MKKQDIITFGLRLSRIGVVVVALGLLIFAVNQNVDALPNETLNELEANANSTNISPNPQAFRLYNNSNSWGGSIFNAPYGPGGNPRSSTNGFKHLLKNEPSSDVRYLTLKAYYATSAEAANASVILRTNMCDFTAVNNPAPSGTAGNNSGTNQDAHRVKFYINGVEQFDEAASAGNKSDACGKFHGTYSAVGTPRPALQTNAPIDRDPATGKYYVQLDFILTGLRHNNTAGLQQVRFQVRASDGGVVGLEKNTPSTKFGIVEAFGDDDDPGGNGVAVGIPFALSCNEGDNDGATVLVYDQDGQAFGKSYAFIMKRPEGTQTWTRFTQSEYNLGASPGATWDPNGGSGRLDVTTGQTNQTVTISMAQYRRGWDYLLVYDNPYQKGQTVNLPSPAGTKVIPKSPTGNVLSFKLPGDTISTQVLCNYKLTPSVSQSPGAGSFAYEADFNVTGSIAIEGTDTDAHNWRLSLIRSTGPPANTAATVNSLAPCLWQASGCSALASGNDPDGFEGPYSTGPYVHSERNTPVGTWVCFMMSVQKPEWNSGVEVWSHSSLVCNQSLKKPRVQFTGSDLRVGGAMTSNPFVVSGRTYGSWIEYGGFSAGNNGLVGSGKGLYLGTNQPASEWNNLTFANSGTYGNYNQVPSASFAATYFGDLPTSGSGLPQSGVYQFNAGDNIGPGGITVASNGTSIVIKKSGTLRIDGNIDVANSGVTGIAGISQVVIVADTIEIGENVQNIDAWLLTRPNGRINTCATGVADLRSDRCDQPLTVNGPISTRFLMLRRTGGANPPGDSLAVPAERFNLRPDAQLWAYNYANKADYAQTDYVQELPPRY